jgi:hypothetical protein
MPYADGMTLTPPPVPQAVAPETVDEHEQHAVVLVPGGATESLWYVAAGNLVPRMSRTDRLHWIEGFVSAMETCRGLANEPLGEVLRESLRLDLELGEYPD